MAYHVFMGPEYYGMGLGKSIATWRRHAVVPSAGQMSAAYERIVEQHRATLLTQRESAPRMRCNTAHGKYHAQQNRAQTNVLVELMPVISLP